MAYSSPVGTAYYISETFASAKTISAVTNANPAAATSTAHGYSDNDEVVFFSGWERANNGIYKVNQTATDNFEFLGLNSTSTTLFSAGSGTGTTQKLSSWIELPQILTINTQGGDPRYFDVRPIKLLQGLKLPDGFNPASISWEFGWDPSLANWATLLNISRSNTLVGYKAVKGTAATYGYGYFAMSEQANQQPGREDRGTFTFSAQGPLISYSS